MYISLWPGISVDLTPFVEAAVDAVLRSGAEVVILTAPGNSRVEVAKRASAKRPGLRVVSYKEGGEGWAVAGERFVEEALGQVERGVGRWLVIPPDTTTANLLYAELRGKKLVEVLYLPEVYKKELKADEEVLEVAKISHEIGGKRREGISLKLMQYAEESREEVERAVKAIRSLSPGVVGFGDVLKRAADAAAEALKTTPISALTGALGALVIAPVFVGIAASLATLASETVLGAASDAAAKFVQEFAARLGVGAIVEPLKKAAEGLLTAVAKRGKARDQFLDSLAKLVKAVIEAKPYVDDDRYEGVVDEVAAQWGLDVVTFRTFVVNLYNLATAKIATEEDLKKLREEVEARLDAVEKEVEELKEGVRRQELKEYLRIGWLEDFEGGKIYRNIFARGDKLYIRVKEDGHVEHEVVVSEAFRKAAERIKAGFVIITGPKGIGKSTLAAWRLWQMLRSGEATTVVLAEGLERGEGQDDLLNLLEACSRKYRGVCGLPVVLYDPSPPISYKEPKEARVAREVEDVLKFLKKDVYEKRGAAVIAVLPKDLLAEEVKRGFGEFVVELDLKDREFISGILDEYSGCRLDEGVKQQLVDEILKMDEGYALIARLAGEELRRKGCRAEEVLKKAQGNALAFIVNYINDLLQVNDRRIKAYSKILPVRLLLAPAAMPGGYIMPTGLLERWIGWEGVYAGEPVSRERELRKTASRWLAVRQHDLVETALLLITIYAVYPDKHEVEESLSKEPEPLREALRPWADYGLKMSKEHFSLLAKPQPYAAARLFLENYGGKLAEALQPGCWRRLALMTGAALTAHPFKALAEAAEEDVKEGIAFEGLAKALAQCGIDSLFLEGGELPPFSRALLVASALPGSPHNVYAAVAHKRGELVQELKALLQKWEERGGFTFAEAVYAVGLAAVLAKGLGVGGELGKEDAEIAIRAASAGVQRALHPDAVRFVVEALSPLGKYAPGEWAALLYGASQIEAISDAVRRELDKLYGSEAEELRRDWVKANMAEAYAGLGDAEKACALLNSMKDGALKTITEAIVHHALTARGAGCPGVDTCKRLEKVVEELEGMGPVLQADVELMEYLKRRWISASEEMLGILLQEARAFALSGLATCALDKGEFDKAVEYFSKAAKIDRDLGEWESYLTDKAHALGALALGALPDKAGELLSGFEELWREVSEHCEKTAPYFEKAAGVLGEYLVALALNGRHGDVEKLLREHGWLLRWNPQVDAATRLMLRLLGARAEEPNPKEVLEAVQGGIKPSMLPALAEALGVPQVDAESLCLQATEVSEECVELFLEAVQMCGVDSAKLRAPAEALGLPLDEILEKCRKVLGTIDLCLTAHGAVRGDAEARGIFEPWARSELAEKGVPRDLLEKADAKRLAEAWAPRNSLARFILLLRALSIGDVDAALLHAEAGRAEFKGKTLGMLYGELTDALHKSDGESLRIAAAKLYYFHL